MSDHEVASGTQPSPEERTLAALAHFFGVVIALIIWLVQKDKSPFIRFQALQALAFDVTLVATAMLLSLGLGVVFIGVSVAAAEFATRSDGNVAAALGVVAVILWLLSALTSLVLMGALFVGRVVAAIATYQGRNYHHPWLGMRVERMLP